jgi:hypothetical protein
MMSGSIAKLASSLILLPCVLMGSGAFGQVQPGPISVAAKSGTEVRVAMHSSWGGSCQSRGQVAVVITKPPSNGEVSVRQTETKPPGCAWSVPATGVFYKSKAGFTGTDTFSYDRKILSGEDSNVTGIRNVTIKVTP